MSKKFDFVKHHYQDLIIKIMFSYFLRHSIQNVFYRAVSAIASKIKILAFYAAEQAFAKTVGHKHGNFCI